MDKDYDDEEDEDDWLSSICDMSFMLSQCPPSTRFSPPKEEVRDKDGNFVCKRCGSCCYKYPCNPLSTDLKEIAKYLEMPLEKVIHEYFIIDYFVNSDESRSYFLVPKRKKDIGKEYVEAPYEWAWWNYSPCLFLAEDTDGKCSCMIYPVRPYGGRTTFCDRFQSGSKTKEWYAEQWGSPFGKELLEIAWNKKE